MEISYRNSMNGSYMMLPKMEKLPVDDFALKMISRNNILGLIENKWEMVNGEGRLLWNVSNKQSFGKLLEHSQVKMQEVKELIRAISATIENLNEYLLDIDKMILDPDLVYTDNERKSFYFCYNPYSEGTMRQESKVLFDKLVASLNYDDTELVKMTYEMSMIVQRDNFSFSELENCVKKYEDEGQVIIRKMFETPEIDEDIEQYIEQKTDDRNMLVSENIQESESFIDKLKIYFKNRKLKEIVTDIDDGVILREIKRSKTNHKINKTEFRRLLSTDDLKGDVIELDKYPFTLGKLSGSVDYTMKAPHVSRVHARIHSDDVNGNFYLEDLGSTNGSFINGNKLEANKRSKLKTGDVVCFADQEYIFK